MFHLRHFLRARPEAPHLESVNPPVPTCLETSALGVARWEGCGPSGGGEPLFSAIPSRRELPPAEAAPLGLYSSQLKLKRRKSAPRRMFFTRAISRPLRTAAGTLRDHAGHQVHRHIQMASSSRTVAVEGVDRPSGASVKTMPEFDALSAVSPLMQLQSLF